MPSENTESFIEAIQPDPTELEKTINQLDGRVVPASQAKSVGAISTGNLSIDKIFGTTGTGGIPRGRITEVFGPESSGKTTLAFQTIAEAQKQGGKAAIIDVEGTFNPAQASTMGVDLDNLLLGTPESAEEAMEDLIKLVRSSALDLIVVDSVAALVTEDEHDGIDQLHFSLPLLLADKIKVIAADARQADTALMILNQERIRNDQSTGNLGPDSTAGKALRHAATIRAQIEKGADIRVAKLGIVGNKTKIKIVKNKLQPAHTEVETDLIYSRGLRVEEPYLFDWALSQGIVTKKGAWYFLPKEPNTLFEHGDNDGETLSGGTWSFLAEKLSGKESKDNSDKTDCGDDEIQLGKGRLNAIAVLKDMEMFADIRNLYIAEHAE